MKAIIGGIAVGLGTLLTGLAFAAVYLDMI